MPCKNYKCKSVLMLILSQLFSLFDFKPTWHLASYEEINSL